MKKNKFIRFDEKVRIIEDLRDNSTHTGKEATYAGNCFVSNGRRYMGPRIFYDFSVMSKFVLDDGSVIWGYQCYWTPLRVERQMSASK